MFQVFQSYAIMIIFVIFAVLKWCQMFLYNNSKSCMTSSCLSIKSYLHELVIFVLNPKFNKTLEADHMTLIQYLFCVNVNVNVRCQCYQEKFPL